MLTAQDRWVAGHTRDALIAARAGSGRGSATSKPIMLIDENGVDHAFCISEFIQKERWQWLTSIRT
jgi:hypothetical protein